MNHYYSSNGITLYLGHCLRILRALADKSVNCCVTSPPYWGLRDYGIPEQIGLEPTPTEYIQQMILIFREVRRVLRDDGTLWLNLGDSYANDTKWGGSSGGKNYTSQAGGYQGQRVRRGKDCDPKRGDAGPGQPLHHGSSGLQPKNLIGVPWRVAFALQDDGWILRNDNIWAKPNGMPESVKDRATRGHEYVFHFSKSERYFYDAKAVKTAPLASTETRLNQDLEKQIGSSRANGGGKTNGTMKAVGSDKQRGHSRRHAGFNARWDAMERAEQISDGANLRTVWWISPACFKEAHFAVMPAKLAGICIAAGCPAGGKVLDPFNGAGTTVMVARELGCQGIGIDLNQNYLDLSIKRIAQGHLFAEVPA